MSDSGSGLLIKTVFILATVFTIIAHNIGTHINVLDYQQIYMISHAIKLLKMHKWVSSRENLSSGGGGGLRSTKSQTSLRIRAKWSAPMLFAYWKVSYVNLPHWNHTEIWKCGTWLYRFLIFAPLLTFLARLCSWGDWFETRFVGNLEDRFCCDETHIKVTNSRWFFADIICILQVPLFEAAKILFPAF